MQSFCSNLNRRVLPCQAPMMELFAKLVIDLLFLALAVIAFICEQFRKKLHHRCLTGLWIHLRIAPSSVIDKGKKLLLIVILKISKISCKTSLADRSAQFTVLLRLGFDSCISLRIDLLRDSIAQKCPANRTSKNRAEIFL